MPRASKLFLPFLFLALACQTTPKTSSYPESWFEPVTDKNTPSWEILPQAAGPGEVILSKRNELGILSNFAATPFTFRGQRYASVEGLWQAMKYPEGPRDERAQSPKVQWKYSRAQVEQMVAFEAKRAGDLASQNMKKLGINWVTFKGKKLTYRTQEKGEHYQLIKETMREKLRQNPEVKRVLLKTGNLKLRPDHKVREPIPPAWKYYEIWMELRKEISQEISR